jgi:glycopeptide antibiotics resistance protein
VTSVKDFAAQTIGAVGGIFAYLALGRRFDEWLAEFVSDRGPDDRAQWVLQAYVVGLVGYSMLPLDVVMSPGELAWKLDSGRIEIIPFTYRYASRLDAIYGYATQAILAVPVGMLGVIAYRRRGDEPRPFLDAVLWAVGVLIAIEVAQLLILSRFTSTTDVLVGTVGAVVGVAVTRRVRLRNPIGPEQPGIGGSGAAKWLAALAIYATLIAIVFWFPYDFTDDRALIKQRMEGFRSIPLSRIYEGSDLNSLFSAVRMVTWYAPFGAISAMCVTRLASSRRARQFGYVVATIGIVVWAVLIELGQVLLPTRFADLTDVMVCGGGGLLGLFVAARLASSRPPAM